ncbi:hypothetical protein AGLY_000540, partial [Aphis glycines]
MIGASSNNLSISKQINFDNYLKQNVTIAKAAFILPISSALSSLCSCICKIKKSAKSPFLSSNSFDVFCIQACCVLTLPETFSISPRKADTKELFPEPTVPTTATNCPDETRKFMFDNVGGSVGSPQIHSTVNFLLLQLQNHLLVSKLSLQIDQQVHWVLVTVNENVYFSINSRKNANRNSVRYCTIPQNAKDNQNKNINPEDLNPLARLA